MSFLLNNIYYLSNFEQISPKQIEDLPVNNAPFENIPKFQRHYSYDNRKKLNVSINILYLQ